MRRFEKESSVPFFVRINSVKLAVNEVVPAVVVVVDNVVVVDAMMVDLIGFCPSLEQTPLICL